MPVYQIKKTTNTHQIGIWKISETENELTEIAINKGISLINKPESTHNTRITQWLSTRLLLNVFFKNELIHYDSFGKPYLNNGWFISISHSNHFVAISINKERNCGIDIEKITPKIDRIKHKFLGKGDLKKIIEPEDLTIYWGAKESLYKYYGKKEVLFIENLFIQNFNKDNTFFTGEIIMKDFQIKLSLTYEKFENFILVYTL